MLVDDYERLMLTGWRRSGSYFYKPCMHLTCCPLFTIRLKAEAFKASKAQRQIERRIQRYLQTGDIHVAPAAEGAAANPQAGKSSSAKSYTLESEKASVTAEKFQLYKKYQVAVHRDEPSSVTESGFANFLVDSPLLPSSGPAGVDLPVRGTHHMLHRIDGQLVAVGVVDLLPSGLSSVYLFYDPDFKPLALGKYTALREIQYCLDNGLPYYYMGFYIHDCDKMKYKAGYCPSELLCPTTLTWQAFSSVSAAMTEDDAAGYAYVPLQPEARAQRLRLGLLPEDHAIRRGKLARRGAAHESGDGGGGRTSIEAPVLSRGWEDVQNVLNQFKPQFPPLPVKLGVDKLPMKLYGGTITVADLVERNRPQVRDILRALLDNVDGHQAWRMDIKIG